VRERARTHPRVEALRAPAPGAATTTGRGHRSRVAGRPAPPSRRPLPDSPRARDSGIKAPPLRHTGLLLLRTSDPCRSSTFSCESCLGVKRLGFGQEILPATASAPLTPTDRAQAPWALPRDLGDRPSYPLPLPPAGSYPRPGVRSSGPLPSDLGVGNCRAPLSIAVLTASRRDQHLRVVHTDPYSSHGTAVPARTSAQASSIGTAELFIARPPIASYGLAPRQQRLRVRRKPSRSPCRCKYAGI